MTNESLEDLADTDTLVLEDPADPAELARLFSYSCCLGLSADSCFCSSLDWCSCCPLLPFSSASDSTTQLLGRKALWLLPLLLQQLLDLVEVRKEVRVCTLMLPLRPPLPSSRASCR